MKNKDFLNRKIQDLLKKTEDRIVREHLTQAYLIGYAEGVRWASAVSFGNCEKIKCTVCGEPAITQRMISIDNAPKTCESVCRIHADAAEEDNSR